MLLLQQLLLLPCDLCKHNRSKVNQWLHNYRDTDNAGGAKFCLGECREKCTVLSVRLCRVFLVALPFPIGVERGLTTSLSTVKSS